jgi:uncharacterized protein (DUF433 family)
MPDLKPSGTAHILLDERGRGWIDGTNVKVIEVILDVIGVNKMTAEQIHEAYPHLSMVQIHAALAWYYDHKAEYDEEIERLDEEYRRIRAQTENPELQRRLRELSQGRRTS